MTMTLTLTMIMTDLIVTDYLQFDGRDYSSPQSYLGHGIREVSISFIAATVRIKYFFKTISLMIFIIIKIKC